MSVAVSITETMANTFESSYAGIEPEHWRQGGRRRSKTTDSHTSLTVLERPGLVYCRGHLNCVIGIALITRTFQNVHLPILPFTAILNVAAIEQPDVTSRILSLACNWLVARSCSCKCSARNLQKLPGHFSYGLGMRLESH